MQKNIYIDVDEEITSILDRIRQETANQIILVVPQKALIAQGVINLKILKREAEQMNKQLIISTTDQQARRVIGRIGLKLAPIPRPTTTPGSNLSNEINVDNFSRNASREVVKKIAPSTPPSQKRKTVGSDSFYSDYSSDYPVPPSLNQPNQAMGIKSKLLPQNTQPKPSQSLSKDPDVYAIKPDSYYSSSRTKNKLELEEEPEFDSEEKSSFLFRRKFQIIFTLLLLIAIGGVWLFKNYPKIQITVSPNKRELSREIKVVSKLDEELDIEKQEIPGRIIEVSLEKTLEFKSTGESYQGESGRAKGTITIINNYSSAPQALVATTRFLSSNGKLFRLVKGITVPGMQADSPGKIQAEIIADKPGDDYNIEPATFTIEGFKGGPKYEKFQVTSETKFSGGRTADSGNALVAISENDLKNAREKTIEELEKSIQAELEKELGKNEKLLLDSTEKTIESATSSSPANTTVNTFTYTIKETVKTIAFNEEDLKKIASAELVKEINENNTLDNNININYKRGLIDFNNKSLTINLEVKSVAWTKLDLDKIKTGIVGKNEKEIKEFLSNYPGLNQAEIFLIPAQLNKFSTTNQNNITVKEEKK